MKKNPDEVGSIAALVEQIRARVVAEAQAEEAIAKAKDSAQGKPTGPEKSK